MAIMQSKWKDEFVITAYELAANGYSKSKIAKVLGVGMTTLEKWRDKRKYFKLAIKKGKERYKGKDGSGGGYTMVDYVFDRLTDEGKRVWRKLNRLDKKGKATVEDLDALFAHHGTLMRQQIALYAWTSNNYSISAALKKAGISRDRWEAWKKDKDFAKLVKEITWHKKNFFEDGLCQLVADGNASATIYANKTQNADRGYSEKLDINITGNFQHQHMLIGDLDLDLDTRRIILEAVKRKEALMGSSEEVEMSMPMMLPGRTKKVVSREISKGL